MLISHKHKFIIIDIPKTGSRSLRETLIPLGIIDVVGKPQHGNFYQHGTITQCKRGFEDLGLDINDYFKYTRVRNPWNRFASFAFYTIQKAKQYEQVLSNKKEIGDCVIKNIDAMKLAHNQWFNIHKGNHQSLLKSVISQRDQSSYILNNGVNAIDMVDKFEDFEKSFQRFCEAVNINPVPELTHGNKGKYNIPWRDIYTQELIDMVAEKEKWVIDKFGYTFD